MVETMLVAAGSGRLDDISKCEDEDGKIWDTTALIESSLKDHTEVVELLIGAKADVNKCAQVRLHFLGIWW